jgi:hypothetical protein
MLIEALASLLIAPLLPAAAQAEAPPAPTALHDYLLGTAAYDFDGDGKPDELRVLAPEAELHDGVVTGRFVADVKLSKSARTVRSPLVFDPEEPDWEIRKLGRPAAREALRFPYLREPVSLEIHDFLDLPQFNLVQLLDAGDPESYQYSLFEIKADGTVARFQEDPDTITLGGDVLDKDRIQLIWKIANAASAPPENPRPVCRWDEPARAEKARAARGFSLCILGENWFELGLGYEAKEALSRLQGHAAQEAVVCFGAESIDRFDWESQRLTLTRAATGRLVHGLARYESTAQRTGAAADFAAGEERLNELMESLGWNSAIESDLRLRAFQVRVDGRFLYGGVFVDPTSQMAIDFPVARVDAEDGCRAAFNILPVHLPFLTEDPVDEDGKIRGLDVTPEAREDTNALDENANFFTRWATESALAPNARAMRKLVRDSAVRRSLEEAGKLEPDR